MVDSEITNRQLYTLKTLQTPSAGRTLARVLLGTFIVFFFMLFLPWQQNIRGKGYVTAFRPDKRPQLVESTIAGRIESWKVREGQFVSAGDTILTLKEVKDKFFDPELLDRLEEQVEAKEQSIISKAAKADALREQIVALKSGLRIKTNQALNKVEQNKLKLISDSVDYLGEDVRFANFKNQYERNKILYDSGITSLTKFQDFESKYQAARMKVTSAENKFYQSQVELSNARIDLPGIQAFYQDKISKSESDLNATLADLYDSQASLAKLKNEYANMQIRNEQYQVIAPQDGYIVRALQAGLGETIKEGEAVVTIMPSESDIAVEMYVRAMDVPLLSQGREVRIEFDGWPALQFSGWPSASVGTFGGRVQVIDYVNSKGGEFRILVTPDEKDEPWPKQLRQGSGIKGWVMLDDVPVWYELWRQLNGFPPSLYEEPLEEKMKHDQEKGKDK